MAKVSVKIGGNMRKVIIQDKFTVEEAAIARAQNPGAVLCTAQNFAFVNFAGAEIIAGNKAKETTYLIEKANKAAGYA